MVLGELCFQTQAVGRSKSNGQIWLSIAYAQESHSDRACRNARFLPRQWNRVPLLRINYQKPVYVYRNLSHGRKSRPLYSIMQNGRVIRHSHRLMMADVRFVVREGGRQRVLRENRKNVHAFAVGYIVSSGIGTDRYGRLPVMIGYNPYNDRHFFAMGGVAWPIKGARFVILNEYGMTGAYLE